MKELVQLFDTIQEILGSHDDVPTDVTEAVKTLSKYATILTVEVLPTPTYTTEDIEALLIAARDIESNAGKCKRPEGSRILVMLGR